MPGQGGELIIRSIGLMTFVNVLKGVISLLLSFYIAKAVSPAEFGLIAFAIPLAALITLLTDLGIASAIVRERSLSKTQAGSALVLMLVFGLVGSGGLALLAAPIQWASGLPGVHDVVLGFALVALFSVWAACPRALIERELQYRIIGMADMMALVVATGGFFLALEIGWGIFALVVFHITQQCIRSLFFLWCARGLFTWVLVPRGIVPLLQTGGWLFASNLLSYASRNLDRFIIAKNLGAAALGLYGFAYQFMTVPLVLLAWPASGVLMATLSRLGDDVERKRIVAEGFLAITAAAVFPMMALIAFQSAYPVQTILSNTWRGVDLYIAVLAPLGALQALAVYSTGTLVANGEVKLSFKLSVLNGTVIPASFLVSAPYGLLTSVTAYVIASAAICCLMLFFMCRAARISILGLLKLLAPGALAALLVGLTWFLPARLFGNPAWDWLFAFSISITLAFCGLMVFRSRLLSALRALVSTRIPKASELAQ